MNELQAALKIVLANTFVMYYKSHTYHWNVEGMLFSQYHDFFGDLYGELYGAVDPIAEEIRALDGYAPISIIDVLSAKTIDEDQIKPVTIQVMLNNLLIANTTTIDTLNKAFLLAAGNNGLQNFLADRLDKHAKHAWMIKSSLKNLGV